MDKLSLYTQINNLPSNLKQEVLDFVQFLEMKLKKERKLKKHRRFGVLKGKIKMSDDFDEPLEEVSNFLQQKSKHSKSISGKAKGLIQMKENFDDPIEE